MAAYPFRKMTTKQLRKLLQDERDRDRSLNKDPGRQAQATHDFPQLKNQPTLVCQHSVSINR